MNFLDELATSIFSFTYFVYVRINKLFDRPSETLKIIFWWSYMLLDVNSITYRGLQILKDIPE